MIKIKTDGFRVRTKIDANTKAYELLITIEKLYEVLINNGVPKQEIDKQLNEILEKREVEKNAKNK